MMNSGCRSSVCQNERNTCGITRGTKSECSGEGGPGFGRWESPMGRTRSRPTADTQRDERAQICEEILCDGKSQTERREERLVAQEHNVEAHAGTGERHCGVTRNINQHTRTETQWSGAAVTKKDVVCEKIFFTSGAGGKAFKDLGDIDSEATVQTTWSPEGFQLTRTIKKVENFKTNCRGDCSPTPTTQITAPSSKNLQSPKGLQSPVCEAVEIKPFKPLCHHPQDPDHACSPGTAYRSPLGFGFGSCVLASMNHVRKAHTWTLCVSCPRQVQPPHRTVSYAFRSRCADCPPSPLNPAVLSRLLNLSRTCLK